jgi:hypothetical protein
MDRFSVTYLGEGVWLNLSCKTLQKPLYVGWRVYVVVRVENCNQIKRKTHEKSWKKKKEEEEEEETKKEEEVLMFIYIYSQLIELHLWSQGI